MSAEDVRLVREALISLPGRPFPEGSIGGLGLAALNRLTHPSSKAQLARWYDQCALRRWLPLSPMAFAFVRANRTGFSAAV